MKLIYYYLQIPENDTLWFQIILITGAKIYNFFSWADLLPSGCFSHMGWTLRSQFLQPLVAWLTCLLNDLDAVIFVWIYCTHGCKFDSYLSIIVKSESHLCCINQMLTVHTLSCTLYIFLSCTLYIFLLCTVHIHTMYVVHIHSKYIFVPCTL